MRLGRVSAVSGSLSFDQLGARPVLKVGQHQQDIWSGVGGKCPDKPLSSFQAGKFLLCVYQINQKYNTNGQDEHLINPVSSPCSNSIKSLRHYSGRECAL